MSKTMTEEQVTELYQRCLDKFFVPVVEPINDPDITPQIGINWEQYNHHLMNDQNIRYGWGLLNTAFTLRMHPKQFTDFLVNEGILFRGEHKHLYPCWGYINWFDMVPAFDKKRDAFYLRPVINRVGMPPIILTLVKAGLIAEEKL